ncbi:hypothetical protein [Streptomyces sp. NPDC006551]|uniref:hypothetical protein n=1 Tax=Streptomyces sp. NPDC006551 TaxID=3157178 RepID=UPI0033ADB43D
MRRFVVTAALTLGALACASAVPAAAEEERETEYSHTFQVHVGDVHIVEAVTFEEEYTPAE